MINADDMCGMPGMEPMSGAHASAPAWLLFTLAVWFAAGALFYLYRILSPNKLRSVYGQIDLENEIGHGICMASMVTMLMPTLLPIPFKVWAAVLGVGASWFAVRTFTWGLKRPGNKWWWDGIHAGMLGFMALMFAGVSAPLLSVVAGAFWVFFTVYAGYYTYKLRRSGPSRGWLELGSDLAHVTMGIAMFVMTVAPSYLMPSMPGMPGMSGIAAQALQNQPATASVAVAGDADFDREILASKQPTVVLVFGGCEKCCAELPVFDKLACEYVGRVKFVRVNKNQATQTCERLGVKQCPTVLFVENGSVAANRLDESVDETQLRKFIDEAVKIGSSR